MMELLVVIVIMLMMLAFSAAAYWKMAQRFKEQGAASDVEIALRQARTAALTGGAPAFVELDAEHHRVTPWIYKPVGIWHFEDVDSYGKSRGGYNDAILRGAELYKNGKIGKCVKLKPNSCVDLRESPDYDCEDGGYLEAYILADLRASPTENYIFYKKDAYSLKIGSGGVLIGFTGRELKSKNYHIPNARWTKVAMAWDRHTTRLMVDDAIVAVGPAGKVEPGDHPLLLGHETASMVGLIDEVRVMSATPGNTIQFPADFEFKHNTSPWNSVYFAADGTLDMRYHPGPLWISLTRDRKMRSIAISMRGETSRSEVENIEKKEVAETPRLAPATDEKGKPRVIMLDQSKSNPFASVDKKDPKEKPTAKKEAP